MRPCQTAFCLEGTQKRVSLESANSFFTTNTVAADALLTLLPTLWQLIHLRVYLLTDPYIVNPSITLSL